MRKLETEAEGSRFPLEGGKGPGFLQAKCKPHTPSRTLEVFTNAW